MYRVRGGRAEFFLAHPGGPWFHGKDDGCWSVPKGEVEAGEDPLAAAVREFEEETGVKPVGPFVPLGTVRQRSGKTVHAWAFAGDWAEGRELRSNPCEIEWPPHSGRRLTIPEIDRAEFFGAEEARRKITEAQRPFLDRVEKHLAGGKP
jgi:predicted NUDIX family NTP pyrophosphohydrolase